MLVFLRVGLANLALCEIHFAFFKHSTPLIIIDKHNCSQKLSLEWSLLMVGSVIVTINSDVLPSL